MGTKFTSTTDPVFDALFDSLGRDVFRLETLQRYATPSEAEELRRFLTGEPPTGTPPNQAWCDEVRAGIGRGVAYQRVHVVREPLSDYVRFECARGYPASVDAGEDVRIVALGPGATWPDGVPRHDLWLFDGRHRVDVTYDESGAFVEGEITDDADAVAEACRARDIAVSLSVPFVAYAAGFDDWMWKAPVAEG